MSDPLNTKIWGTEARVTTNPLPEATADPPLLQKSPVDALHRRALVILREQHALDGSKTGVDQRAYDAAVRQASDELGVSATGAVAADVGDDPMLDEVRAKFRSSYADFDQRSALAHLRAVTVLAASGKRVCEETYLAALFAVSAETARSTNADELDKDLEAAEALSDLAQARLAERRDFPSASGYEQRYLGEISRLADQFGVRLYDR
jgi:hypothetical protein